MCCRSVDAASSWAGKPCSGREAVTCQLTARRTRRYGFVGELDALRVLEEQCSASVFIVLSVFFFLIKGILSFMVFYQSLSYRYPEG